MEAALQQSKEDQLVDVHKQLLEREDPELILEKFKYELRRQTSIGVSKLYHLYGELKQLRSYVLTTE